MISDDFDYLTLFIQNRRSETILAEDALDQIKEKYRKNLNAVSRVTELCNKMSAAGSYAQSYAKDVREALGDAYLGGPLL